MEEQVLQNLIALYKSKGVSLDSLLVNPVFANLPVEAKIQLVKNHAKELSSGIKFDKHDALNMLKVVGAGAGVYGVYRLASSVMKKIIDSPQNAGLDINSAAKNAVMIVTPLALAATPTAGMFINSIQHGVASFGRKRAAKEYLKAIQENRAPDDNAIRLLGFAHETIKE